MLPKSIAEAIHQTGPSQAASKRRFCLRDFESSASASTGRTLSVRKSSPVEREPWLIRHRVTVVVVLLGAALAVRAAYFLQLNRTPLVALHKLEQLDMHVFDSWGRRIAAGDWALRTEVPMHPWHHDVARYYLSGHPDEARRLGVVEGSKTSAAEAALWRRWMNGDQYYQDPLYAYLLALTYRIAGPDVRWVFAWQLILGALSTLIVWDLTRRAFGDAAAIAAAALALLAAPIMYFEMILLREASIIFAGLALTWLIVRGFETGRTARFAGLGAAIGFATLLKATFALFGVAVLIALGIRLRRRGVDWRAAAALAGGGAIAITPLVIRNVSLGVPPFALASSGPMTFAFANVPDYPRAGGFYIDVPYLSRVLGEADGRALPQITETLALHTPGSMATLMWHKLDQSLYWYEIQNNDNFYYMQVQAPVLQWLPVTAFVLVPLGLVGIVLSTRAGRDRWPLYLLVACSFAPLMIFYVLGRLRAPFLVALVPFAGLTLATLAQWIRNGRIGQVAAAGGAVLALMLWTGRGQADGEYFIRPVDWMLPYMIQYRQDVANAVKARDAKAAVDAYFAYFKYEPDLGQVKAMGSPELADSLAELHRQCSLALAELHRFDEAGEQRDKMQALLSLAGR